MTSTQLITTIADLSSRYHAGRGQLDLLRRQAEEKRAVLNSTRANIDLWEKVRLLLTKTSEFARENAVRQVESLVTSALRAIFGDDSLSFRVVLDTRGGQPTADWEVVSRYGDLTVATDPEDARGGGIVDVVSMALRLAVAVLTDSGDIIILDEPGKMISAEYPANLAYFLKQFAVPMPEQNWPGCRIVMVTHNQALAEAADVWYRVTQQAGVSEVKRIG